MSRELYQSLLLSCIRIVFGMIPYLEVLILGEWLNGKKQPKPS